MVRRRVQTRIERKSTGPPEWLVITRRPLPDERPMEPRASRTATDQDARYRYHYYLSPTCVSEVELEEPSLGELARVIQAGACIEASFKRGKARWAWMSIGAHLARLASPLTLSLIALVVLLGEATAVSS